MRKRKVLLAVVVMCLVLPTLSGHTPKDEKKSETSDLMRKKLQSSQKVLEGITKPDYKLISASAEEMIAISKEVEWKVIKTPRYEVYTTDFRRSAEDLIKAAKEKNTDAAALAYVDMTLTCVKCHKHVREERMTLFKD